MKRFFGGLLLSALAACSPAPSGNDGATGDASSMGDSGGGALPGEGHCANVPAPTMPCARPSVASCGVCVAPPEDSMADRLRRTPCADLDEADRNYCDMAASAAPPNLGCFTNYNAAMPPSPPTSQMVTVWGVVNVFGTGGDADNVRVEIFRANEDGTTGAMVGMATAMVSTYSELAVRESGGGRATRRLGGFKIDNVPSDTRLIVRTSGDPNFFRHPIYDYTLPIRARELAMPPADAAMRLGITGMAVRIRPRVLANADWTTIPSTATLTSGIRMGNGAIAGEVHDCDDVRLSNATVYGNPAPDFASTVYFSNNPANPLPDTTRNTHGTQLLGLYALLDARPGPLRLTAVGYDPSGTLTHIGGFAARVFPDAVTVVTFRGNHPLNR